MKGMRKEYEIRKEREKDVKVYKKLPVEFLVVLTRMQN
jgi:hypothetical protein